MNDYPICLMFHSIGLNQWFWRSSHVSEPIEAFERKIAALADTGWYPHFISEIPPGLNSTKLSKIFCLTFDDGYLDNWVHVFPILEKFQIKATIFVTPEFVDPRNVVRPQVSPGSFTKIEHRPELCCAGFLSWPEMREMESSGLIDIQSHALTHTWYFNGPNIVDFWHPGAATESEGPVWMLWNSFRDFKPFYLIKAEKYESKIPFGTPIYENGKALESKRFVPKEDALSHYLVNHVEENGGEAFFSCEDWRKQLDRLVALYRDKNETNVDFGIYETTSEYYERVRKEITQSKDIIEKELNKKIEVICWPGGGVTEEVVSIARDCGYKYYTLPSAWKTDQSKGKHSEMIPRIGSMGMIKWHGREIGVPSGREFIWYIKRKRGSKLGKWLGYFSKALRIAYYFLKKIQVRLTQRFSSSGRLNSGAKP